MKTVQTHWDDNCFVELIWCDHSYIVRSSWKCCLGSCRNPLWFHIVHHLNVFQNFYASPFHDWQETPSCAQHCHTGHVLFNLPWILCLQAFSESGHCDDLGQQHVNQDLQLLNDYSLPNSHSTTHHLISPNQWLERPWHMIWYSDQVVLESNL